MKLAHHPHTGSSPGHVIRRSFPPWLHRPVPQRGAMHTVEHCLREHTLHTVCEEARCPNRCECFAKGTATFLIMGTTCTRNCLFCSINHGTPQPLDPQEPQRVYEAVQIMNLSYVVITSVTRDDLQDGGAQHFAQTISLLKRNLPQVKVEVLVPDFSGSTDALATVLKSKPDVFNHNIETVASVYPHIRPEADYTRSLSLLRSAAACDSTVRIKSGFMVGLGETREEVIALLHDLHEARVSIVTIGQYLQPGTQQALVKEFISPEQFERYRCVGKEIGFAQVVAGPFVRSSYQAAEVFSHAVCPDGSNTRTVYIKNNEGAF